MQHLNEPSSPVFAMVLVTVIGIVKGEKNVKCEPVRFASRVVRFEGWQGEEQSLSSLLVGWMWI